MREALAGVRNAERLATEFYDANRIATWVRSHEGLIPWVRRLVGKAVPGWQSYGPWAYAGAYLFDDKARLHPRNATHQGLSALAGIQQLREELGQERRAVRLVGLSGVGKTRLVQALFDERVATDSLNPDLAIYTNMSDSPDPQPIAVASNLIAAGERAILVIDNCAADLHQRLSELCRDPKSRLSVLTIEYDIREDTPEGTEVFRLDSSSPELIERLLQQRFPALSQIDRHTIAGFSGGNARIAIALADTIEHNESVAGLTDDQVFQRLFVQRQAPDEALYLAAQACSLVYSFQGEDVSTSDPAELFHLGALIGKTPQEVYRSVAELRRRDLVQQRGPWRAVLPHAIANRLAAVALQNVAYAGIEEHLLATERLMKSFSRRLGYLHTSKEAVGIVKNWIGPGGLLADVAHLNELGRTMLENVAPVCPAQVLTALEQGLRGLPADEVVTQYTEYVDLLRSIAYDPVLFERCTTLLVAVATAGEAKERSHAIDVFVSLFHLFLSGTRASIEQRSAVIKGLLDSPDPKRQALGVRALHAVLEAWHFLGGSDFDFGARSRDFGYWPRTNAEVQEWFRHALKLVEAYAVAEHPMAAAARGTFAEQFRSLWHKAGIQDEMTALCRTIRKVRFWPEGWLAIRQTLDLDGKGLAAEARARLIALEVALRPQGLPQKVRSVVFSTRLQGVDLDDFEDHSKEDIGAKMRRTDALAQDLGAAVATDEAVLRELLPEHLIVGANYEHTFWRELRAVFIRDGALADAGGEDPVLRWDAIRDILERLRPGRLHRPVGRVQRVCAPPREVQRRLERLDAVTILQVNG